jgi:hypothetical protein
MAPSETAQKNSAEEQQSTVEAVKSAVKNVTGGSAASKGEYIRKPLELSGALDKYEAFDVTPVIGREFVDAQLTEWLEAENSDELIRDLAITSKCKNRFQLRFVILFSSLPVSQRGVVFFRAQDGLTNDLQKKLAHKLGVLTGKPSTSTLHIHPVSNAERELGGSDNEISVISSEQAKKIYYRTPFTLKQSAAEGWHSDISKYRVTRSIVEPT